MPVFTTRPDTLFGATFFVLAPEHPLVERIDERHAARCCARTRATRPPSGARSARPSEEKTGVFTGFTRDEPGQRRADPDLGRRLRADGVRHRRDHGRAGPRRARLRVRRDVRAADRRRSSHARSGATLVDSGDGSSIGDCLPRRRRRRSSSGSASKGAAKPTVNYRLRDWSFSRQRYWGCPIPIVYCDACGVVPVPDDDLPVLLPEVEDYRPKGVPPLASNEEWLHVPCPSCGGRRRRREADTMDTFVDSSWYFLRYCRPAQRRGAVRARGRRLLVPGRPVHRRHRPRDRAPALLALLRQGDERARARRLPRAVRAAVPPGLGAPRRHEDVEVEGERRSGPTSSSTRTAPTRVRLYILFIGPADQDMEWTGHGRSRASCASSAGCGGSCTRWQSGGRRPRGRRRRRSRGRRTRRSPR